MSIVTLSAPVRFAFYNIHSDDLLDRIAHMPAVQISLWPWHPLAAMHSLGESSIWKSDIMPSTCTRAHVHAQKYKLTAWMASREGEG